MQRHVYIVKPRKGFVIKTLVCIEDVKITYHFFIDFKYKLIISSQLRSKVNLTFKLTSLIKWLGPENMTSNQIVSLSRRCGKRHRVTGEMTNRSWN